MACPVVGSGGDGPIPVGRRHPVLDCLIATSASLIGVESKQFEPFRAKRLALFSDVYWRSCWGRDIKGHESVRDRLRKDGRLYDFIDAAQPVKHAFALRTESHRRGSRRRRLVPILFIYTRTRAHGRRAGNRSATRTGRGTGKRSQTSRERSRAMKSASSPVRTARSSTAGCAGGGGGGRDSRTCARRAKLRYAP